MDLSAYRNSASEIARVSDLLDLLPPTFDSALDVGARDGFISRKLADRCAKVVALDLVLPVINDPRVQCVKGDITSMQFPDRSFSVVFCAEVLEHIPSRQLQQACNELGRVCDQHLVIGVPYKQDIRVGRMTCYTCGAKNPPWGHVNSFDENRLQALFPGFKPGKMSFVGTGGHRTNALSCWLMDLAGNPYGTYDQEEPCVSCGAKLLSPPRRSFVQKVLTKGAFMTQRLSQLSSSSHGNWIHILFQKT